MDGGVPELPPARMLNEYAYCPRLFYLEWVQARFAHNADTTEGSVVHRRVDQPAGDLTPNEEFQARSVSLSSQFLGLIAKLDVVQGTDGYVRPIDYKKGKAPDIAEGAYEPERVQLCAQGLLLRDAGYRCEEGILYFAGSHRRVTITFDSALIRRTLKLAKEARKTAESDIPPPPLIDSPKCPRCSLVGICLPDEINSLTGKTTTPTRRLVPSAQAARPLYVTEQGAMIGVRDGRYEVRKDQQVLASVRFLDVSQINVFGNVQVSSQALRRAFSQEVPVCFFSHGGWFSGIAEGLPSKHVTLRIRQVIEAGRGGLETARSMVVGKIRNCRTMLRRNARRPVETAVRQLGGLIRDAEEAVSVASLLGIEGTAARIYFGSFPTMLREDLDITPGADAESLARTRRPPKDPINCLLSYLYALLVKDCTATALGVGFDPYIGLYHRPRFGRPALALDLMEEFRPIVADSVAVTLLNTCEITASDFIRRAGGVALTDAGRRTVLRAYERRLDTEIRHPLFQYRITYRRVLEVQARLLGAYLLGEVPTYTAFTTR